MSTELILFFGLGTVLVVIFYLVGRYTPRDDKKKKADGDGGILGFMGGDRGGSDGGPGGGFGGGGDGGGGG